jgi:two-component system, NarL family, sensor histidine kinase DevS
VTDRATRSVVEVARSVLAELDLDVVLERILDSARELTHARYAALGVLNESRTELARFLTRGIDERTHAGIGALPRGRGLLGMLIEDPAPLRLADVGQHPRSYGFPHGHPPMRAFLGVPILVDGEPYGNLYLTEKEDEEEFSPADEEAVLVLADFAGVAIDHARRYTGTREHRDRLERTVATLEATTQIARAIGGETDLDVVLELVAKRGRSLVSARALLIELKQGDELVVAAGAGELPPGVIGRRVPLADTVASHAMRTLRPQRLEQELNRVRFEEHGLGRLGIKAEGGLVVPLVFRGAAHGVLLAVGHLHGPRIFSTEEEQLLEAFAVSAAAAVATAQMVASERYRQRLAATEGERQRWARELHDETLQSLSALRIGLGAAARSDRPESLREAVVQAMGQLEESIANLRALITDLRPAALDQLGVQAALEGLAERGTRSGLTVDVRCELSHERGHGASTRLAPELETALYRIAQEALTNAARHGGASRVVIDVCEDPTSIQLSVSDDGSGFDPRAETKGFGLLGMRERVELLGGGLELDSAPGAGAKVVASFPPLRALDADGAGTKTGEQAVER